MGPRAYTTWLDDASACCCRVLVAERLAVAGASAGLLAHVAYDSACLIVPCMLMHVLVQVI